MKLAVKFYKTEAGNEPVREWLKSLPENERKIIGSDIMTVQYGFPVGMPLVKQIDKGLFEIRSNLPDRIARVIFTVMNGEAVLLLHGFIKKSQKIEKKELELAKKRLKDVK
ncbi:MAG: type II toxin-antitoxin system RelE/ParE family toxin [Campylobacterales bacterium]